MPELPEVETVRRGLSKLVLNKRIVDLKVYNPGSFAGEKKNIIGNKIIDIRRRAKVLIIDLSNNYSLVIHLKMTGQLVYRGEKSWGAGHPTDSLSAKLPDRSTRIEFVLEEKGKEQDDSVLSQTKLGSANRPMINGIYTSESELKIPISHVYFNDQRKFGWVKLMPSDEVKNLPFLKKVGPEPLSDDPKLNKHFLNNIRRHNNTTIKSAILDQTTIAGIGNIYADESLWATKIHPSTRVKDLSDKKLKELLENAIKVMSKSIESGGSTMKTYIKADGTKGNYLEKFANVFRLNGKPCSRCRHTIEKTRVAGRGTHFCPHCQKPPKEVV